MVLHLVRCLVDGVVVAVIGDVGPTRAGTISRERGPSAGLAALALRRSKFTGPQVLARSRAAHAI